MNPDPHRMKASAFIWILGVFCISIHGDLQNSNKTITNYGQNTNDPNVVNVTDSKVVTVEALNPHVVTVNKDVEVDNNVVVDKTVNVQRSNEKSIYSRDERVLCNDSEYFGWNSFKAMLWNLDTADLALSYLVWCGIVVFLIYLEKMFELVRGFYKEEEEEFVSGIVPQIIYFNKDGCRI
jgi:hypothetical protein